MIRDYQMTIPAGGSEPRQVFGSYVALARSSVDSQVIRVVGTTQSGEVVIDVGLQQGEKIPASRPFNQLRFTNPGPEDVEITVVAGDSPFDSDRMSGVVSVEGVVSVDTVPKIQHPRYSLAIYPPSAASKFQHHELHNPEGSGKDLHISFINAFVGSGAVGGVMIVSNQTSPAPTSPASGRSLSGDIVDAAARYGWRNESSYYEASYTYNDSNLIRLQGENMAQAREYDTYPVVRPGDSLIAYCNTAATIIGLNVEWEERDAV